MEGFTKFLDIGDEIDIMIFIKDGTSLTLKSFVYEVSDETHLIVGNPIKEGVLYPMERSNEYYFRFYKENVGMYLFKGNVVNRLSFDHLPSIKINLISDIKKVQRRRFYRVKFMSDGNFITEKKFSESEIEGFKQKCITKYGNSKDILLEDSIVKREPFDTLDLSGGGLKVLTKKAFNNGDSIEGEFMISSTMVRFKGEVTRIEWYEASNRYEVGIRFLELDSNTQEKIVAYVFEIERNLIKKGLI